jgi:hypothetical protein
MAIYRYIIARAREASTWRGLILLFFGSWAAAHPDQAEALISAAIILSGAVSTLFPDMAPGTANRRETDNQVSNE